MQQLLRNLDALLITNPTNIRYLTGFVGAAENEREAYVLVTPMQTFLFTNALYREEAKKLASLKRLNLLGTKGLTFIEISRENPFAKKLGEVVTKGMRVGFEETDLTFAEHHKIRLEHKNVMLVSTKDRIEKLRMIKRKEEIENIRRAAKLTDQCFDVILGKIKPGVSEKDIAWMIESFIREKGAQLAFSPIVAFGKNTSQPHYDPNFTRPRLEIEAPQGEALKTQDIILLDFGARINGYCADMTRVVFAGKPKIEWVRAYEAVRAAQQAALDYLQRSRSGATADRIARSVIKKPYPHSLGHGVGMDIHEAPRLTIKKNVALKPGMVVTIEPAIYREGSYGIRIEDLIVLKEDGVELLSKSKKEMIIL